MSRTGSKYRIARPQNDIDRPLPEAGSVYVAQQDFVRELRDELRLRGEDILDVRGRLILCRGSGAPSVWAQNIWLTPRRIDISSVGEGARALADIQRNWSLHIAQAHIRRAKLIQAKLPYVSAKPHIFGTKQPAAALGSWTLWDDQTILASPFCTSAFPDGQVIFQENKTDPPSRAYLKLWEVFTVVPELHDSMPGPGDLCLDLGSAPGGWTWALASMGASVFSIDRAPLAANVEAMPNVSHCIGSGFGLDPRHAGAVDWFFSDMICYPSRLYEAVTRWLEYGQCRRFVCTIKLQAETDHEIVRRFAEIPHSRVLHLSCNRHELTWIRHERL
ncbi:MAG: SAM-dependent methyltransferase [Desulfovibrionaceae bacterium]|nr:SAM-dependent methyltransferase [Desulfovibrionaceae bacterium]